MNFQHLPKVELHLHLDCSLSYTVVSEIDPAITLEEYQSNFIAPPKCVDLMDYLTRAPSSYPLMQTDEQLRLVTFDLFEQLQQDNVIYAEIRFAPLLHTEEGLSAHEVVASVEEATAEAVRKTGIEARIILCTLRYYSTEQSLETVKLVEDFNGTYVAAFDIAADTTLAAEDVAAARDSLSEPRSEQIRSKSSCFRPSIRDTFPSSIFMSGVGSDGDPTAIKP